MGNVTFLGVEGSGKTVLMSALVNLFKVHQTEKWYLRPETRSAFRFIEHIPEDLSLDHLPHQTTTLKYLAWSVLKDGQVLRQMDMLDYPGEIYRLAFLDAKDDLDPERFMSRVHANKEEIDELLKHLFNSDQVFVLFNLSDAKDIDQNEKNLDAIWVTNACLDYLHRLPNKPNVTLLLTQIDRYIDVEKDGLDARAYVERHLPLIANNFPDIDVMAVSATGPLENTVGLNQIIEKCFSSTEVVKSEICACVEMVRNVQKFFTTIDLFDVKTSDIDVGLENLNNYEIMHQALPWFVLCATYSGRDMLTSMEVKELKEVCGFLKKYSLGHSDDISHKMDNINYLIKIFRDVHFETRIVLELCKNWLNKLIELQLKLQRLQEKKKRLLHIFVCFIFILIGIFEIIFFAKKMNV